MVLKIILHVEQENTFPPSIHAVLRKVFVNNSYMVYLRRETNEGLLTQEMLSQIMQKFLSKIIYEVVATWKGLILWNSVLCNCQMTSNRKIIKELKKFLLNLDY